MNKFLVTGAMGFIGSYWCEFLLRQGKIVYGLDLEPNYPELLEYDNFYYIHDTIKNYDILRTAVNNVDCVCHFAGIAEPDLYTKFPRKILDVTAVAGIDLIEMCRLKNKLFLFTSTSEIYGKNNKIPFKEDDDRVLGSTMTRRWCYSTSKAVVEHYLDACAFSRELNYIIVRLFNVYGPRLKGRVVSLLLDNAIKNEDLVIHGDGTQTRSFAYIDDVIEAFSLLVNDSDNYNQVFNIGNPQEHTINDLAEKILMVTKSSSRKRYVEHFTYYGKSYEDISRRVPDITKIQQFTGWEPKTNLEDGLSKTVAYYQEKGIENEGQ